MIDYNDLNLYNLPMLLGCNKNRSYKEEVLSRGKVLVKFLFDNQLLKINPYTDDGTLREDLIIKIKDVTEDGDKLFTKAVNDWWRYLDRSTIPGKYENIKHLEKGLKRIREGAEK